MFSKTIENTFAKKNTQPNERSEAAEKAFSTDLPSDSDDREVIFSIDGSEERELNKLSIQALKDKLEKLEKESGAQIRNKRTRIRKILRNRGVPAADLLPKNAPSKRLFYLITIRTFKRIFKAFVGSKLTICTNH